MVDDGEALHRLLFPVGPRQHRALGPDRPELMFLALHRGLAQAFDAYARSLGAGGAVLAWLRLDDEPGARELLRGGDHITVATPIEDLGDAYATALDPDLRHRLGEHYTPRDLVRRVIRRFTGADVVADPACGDGRFLIALLDDGHEPDRIWGADLNPLAVMMARINVWDRLGRPTSIPPTRVVWGDFILQGATHLPPELARPAGNLAGMPVPDAYVGNPPWVTWRNLSDGYRRAVADHLANSRLHHATGWSARVSAGQTDLAHIFVHDAMERVAPGGRLGFVLPRTVFKAPVGPGRVREGVTTNGRPYRFEEVWDCDAFDGVRVDTVVAFAQADAKPEFPVRWIRRDQAGRAVLSDPDDPASPWLTPDGGIDARPLRLASGRRWTGQRGRGGINTGGGNAAFYVEVLARDGDRVTIRSLPSRHRPGASVEATVEATYLRPLLRGRDVQAGAARPSGHVLVPHRDDDLRKPVSEAELARAAPDTYAYLSTFKGLLAGRKELARWPAQPWYALFRIGPYTAGCWRVVWPHSANGSLRAAVLAADDRTVPDQKVVLVAFDRKEPALFLAALLNSAVVRAAASASGGLDA
ncbi:MAG TPA: N-6 DNA methylase, partial [Micromonosporaceae bacterium]